MVAFKATGKVDRGRTLAVLVPPCDVGEGEYDVLVVLEKPSAEPETALTFSDHHLGTKENETHPRSDVYDDDAR